MPLKKNMLAAGIFISTVAMVLIGATRIIVPCLVFPQTSVLGLL